MNVILFEVERRRDGKAYPVRYLSPAERARARVLAHRLVHGDRLTVRAAQSALAAEHGLRRSIGSIMKDLQGWECKLCEDGWPPPSPPQPQKPLEPPPEPEPWPWTGACPM